MTRTAEGGVPATVAQRWPFDLAAVVVVAVAVVLMSGGAPSPLRVVLGLLLVFVLPGYALVAVLFPERALGEDSDADIDGLYGISPGIRAVLSVGLSIFIAPLVGILYSFSPVGVSEGTVLPTLAALTVFTAAVAGYRRLERPPARRFGLQFGTWFAAAGAWVRTDGETGAPGGGTERFDVVLNVALAVGIVAATVGLAAAVGVPTNGERFTAFGLLTEDATGELVATDYPDELVVGESATLYLDVQNREGRAVDYVVVVELQRLADDGTVLESTELDRLSRSLAAGEDWQTPHEVTPTDALTGTDLRLTYLLYVESVPTAPSTENAHRATHIWVDVVEDGR